VDLKEKVNVGRSIPHQQMRDRRSLDILSVKNEAKLSASELAEV